MFTRAASARAEPQVADRINDAVDQLDDVIRELRQTVFQKRSSLRHY